MPFRRELANAIRDLSVDAVKNTNSGHPGAPDALIIILQFLERFTNMEIIVIIALLVAGAGAVSTALIYLRYSRKSR